MFGGLTKLKKLKLPNEHYMLFDEFEVKDETIPLVCFGCFRFFQSVEILKFRELPKESVIEFVLLTTMLINLKELDVKIFPKSKKMDGMKNLLDTVLLDNFSRFEYVKLPRVDYLNCYQTQKRFPNCRFEWHIRKGFSQNRIGKYEGNFNEENNNREGQGVYVFEKSRYEGEWKNDKMNGKGVYIWEGWYKYEGDWVNGKREGKGKITYSSGDTYDGEWKNDNRNGFGVKIWKRTGNKYEGEWLDGKEDKGTMIYSNGDIYVGDWVNGKREGRGIITYKHGYPYEGGWKDDYPYLY